MDDRQGWRHHILCDFTIQMAGWFVITRSCSVSVYSFRGGRVPALLSFSLRQVGGQPRRPGRRALPWSLSAVQDGGKDHLSNGWGRTQFAVLAHPPPKILGMRMGTFASLVGKNLFCELPITERFLSRPIGVPCARPARCGFWKKLHVHTTRLTEPPSVDEIAPEK